MDINIAKEQNKILLNPQTSIIRSYYHFMNSIRYFIVEYTTPFGFNYSIHTDRDHVVDYALFSKIIDNIKRCV